MRNCETDSERARVLYDFVRDSVKYRLGLYRHSASETLDRRSGSCSNKANLLVAMLRAVGIPAGFRLMQVKTKEYFGPLCTEQFHRFLSERSLHVFCAALIDGCWVCCDPSDDRQLSEATTHINPQSRRIHFDGENDAVLHIEPEHVVLDDPTIHDSIDDVLSKGCRKAPIFLEVLDLYLDFMRDYGRRYDSADGLSRDFLDSLQRTCPKGYTLITGDDVEAA